jgi:pheromone shutdown protein TraB
MWNKIKHSISHRLQFWTWKAIKEKFKKYGLPFLIIFIAWEIFEDVISPLICWLLGTYYDPIFYAGIPVLWIACLHPVAVPLTFAIYCWITRKKASKEDINKFKKEIEDECKNDGCGT